MSKVRRSPWRDEVYAPPDLTTPQPSIVYFGCRPWEPARDLAMGRQDAAGLWQPGPERSADFCRVCGHAIEPGAHCAGCSASPEKIEKRLADEYARDVWMAQEEARRLEEERAKESFAERMHGKRPA